MQNNNWNSLKDDYEDLSTKPSQELWEKLNDQLNNEKTKTVSKFNFIKIAAVLLLFLSVGAIFYFNQNKDVLNTTKSNPEIAGKIKSEKRVDLIKLEDNNPPKTENLAVNSAKEITPNSAKVGENNKFSSNKSTANYKSLKIDSGNSSEKLTLTPDLKLKPEVENVPKIAEVQYVKADELLFARELNRNDNKENIQKKAKMGLIDANGISKPKSVKILGFTVYSDSSDSN